MRRARKPKRESERQGKAIERGKKEGKQESATWAREEWEEACGYIKVEKEIRKGDRESREG